MEYIKFGDTAVQILRHRMRSRDVRIEPSASGLGLTLYLGGKKFCQFVLEKKKRRFFGEHRKPYYLLKTRQIEPLTADNSELYDALEVEAAKALSNVYGKVYITASPFNIEPA